MLKISYAEAQDYLNRTDLAKLPSLKISVLRNIMLEPIEPYLRYLACEIGFNAQIVFGEYDNVFQEAIGESDSRLLEMKDCILVFIRLDTLSWDLARNFASLSNEQIDSEVNRIKGYASSVLLGIRKQTNAMILWHGFETPPYPARGILDSQDSKGQQAIIFALNEYLRSILRSQQNVYFVDINLCLSRLGVDRFYDIRYWHIGRAPFSREALREIASEDFKFIRSLKGKRKKCLALDCDNILWGGIVGEVGVSGIKLSRTYPGSPYYEFQQEVINLYNQGIILAICSKNNEEDVWEVFQKHPDMLLKRQHIATAQINWRDKAANLKQIAADLNIGLESMVLVDDSEFEVNMVRKLLPEVEVIYMPEKGSVEYRDILASCGLFDTPILSEEDKKRGALYKSEAARKELQAAVPDIETYYTSLEMELEISYADEFSIQRVAQLTQKTNQFNLTTRRYSEADIKKFAHDRESDVIHIRLKDRFGDAGIVGVCILKYNGEEAIVDTFLLSCRVLGRGVEDAFLVQALKLAKRRGCRVVIGEYYATRKNSQVENFYSRQGFDEIRGEQCLADKRFQYRLESGLAPEPAYFKGIEFEIDKRLEV